MQLPRIPVNDLRRHVQSESGLVRAAIDAVLERGSYVLGPECELFEREFANFCGTGFCVGVANGTDALELSLRSLGIGPGHRVGTVANAGFYSSTAILLVGAEPVYLDVDSHTQLADLDSLQGLAAAGALDAVIVTHLFGLMHDARAIRDCCDKAGIAMVEDCAQAHGAKRDGSRAGSIGHVSAFSFYPTKNLGAMGDGGAVVTNDPALAERLACLRQYGWDQKYRVRWPGGRNSRLDEIQAAVLRSKLPRLDSGNERRRAIASRYSREISHPRVTCPAPGGEEYVAHLYVIACDERSSLASHLSAAGIGTAVHYPTPDHMQPVMPRPEARPRLPVTERLADQVLSLPCFPELTDDEVSRVIEQLNAWNH